MIPGEYLLNDDAGAIAANAGRTTLKLVVSNTGDRPIQVGSHFHFFETNRALKFERETAYGLHLNIAAGTAVRFEPGEEKEVELVEFGGARQIYGHNALVNGDLADMTIRAAALLKMEQAGFGRGQGGQLQKKEQL